MGCLAQYTCLTLLLPTCGGDVHIGTSNETERRSIFVNLYISVISCYRVMFVVRFCLHLCRLSVRFLSGKVHAPPSAAAAEATAHFKLLHTGTSYLQVDLGNGVGG